MIFISTIYGTCNLLRGRKYSVYYLVTKYQQDIPVARSESNLECEALPDLEDHPMTCKWYITMGCLINPLSRVLVYWKISYKWRLVTPYSRILSVGPHPPTLTPDIQDANRRTGGSHETLPEDKNKSLKIGVGTSVPRIQKKKKSE